jgi:hypothetical protein
VRNPEAAAARATARRLQADGQQGLVAEVEAELAARSRPPQLRRYGDPVELASLIVSAASLAWTVYADLRRRASKPPEPPVKEVTRIVRATLRERGQDTSDRVVDMVVAEVIRTVDNQQPAPD